jgi:hypothetical protein
LEYLLGAYGALLHTISVFYSDFIDECHYSNRNSCRSAQELGKLLGAAANTFIGRQCEMESVFLLSKLYHRGYFSPRRLYRINLEKWCDTILWH